MAKYYDGTIDKNTDWGGDSNTGGLPVSGRAVQEFIKDSLNNKMGVIYMDDASNKYLLFPDEETKDEYIDTRDVSLVMGSFDAPANYTATIYLTTPSENTVLVGSTGNKIEFTFETTNKSGGVMGESVTCTYTITRGAYKQVVKRQYNAYEAVAFPVDDYLASGTTNINISIVGSQTLAATAVTVRFKAVELNLSSSYDISKTYNMGKDTTVAIDYSANGYGTKVVEWYLNGVQLEQEELDTIKDSSYSGIKYIDINKFNLGRNEIEFRVGVEQDDTTFYSKTIHKDVAVINSSFSDNIAMVSYETETLGAGIVITQFEKYVLTVAGYSPTSSNAIDVSLDGSNLASVTSKNNVQSSLTITPKAYGNKEILVSNGNSVARIPVVINKTSLNISEITQNLTFAFDADGKTNNSSDRNTWISDDGGSRATLSGFDFDKNGWIDGGLVMTQGCSIDFTNSAFLSGKSLTLGRTIEIEFESTDVKDDDTTLISLMSNRTGLNITATEAILANTNGESVSTKFDNNSRQRITFVINRSTTVSEKGLFYIYVNGELSGAEKYGVSDFTNNNELSISIGEGAGMILYNIRVYDMALTEEQVINNYILYRTDVTEMLKAYNRNNIYEEGSSNFNMSALQSMCPVMIITGNVPKLLNATSKKEQIVVDIEYTNIENPELNFTVTNGIMTPQGTSSMAYPIKNFRLYTNKSDNTVLTVNGTVSEDNLYSFKPSAQPVDCWCFKADFAESSGTHNTGIARLWNTAMSETLIDGEYKLRTQAQKKAKAAGYEYDVRTCVDGFPIIMFYKLTAEDNPVFIGKFNFNNDKSTESVFGFVDIPNFDNSKVECWEGLNNGDSLGNFTTNDFYDKVKDENGEEVERWTEAFEARYPDGNTDTTALYRLQSWVYSTKNNVDKFSTEKYDYFDVYKLAAYYIYVMRFAAVDQLVKNTMLTTEDGKIWYFINYDNDTICGLTNDGDNRLPWDIRRGETIDGYGFAGSSSVLWDNMQNDGDFQKIVMQVDEALSSSYLDLDEVLDMLNEKQAATWSERIYNLDAKAKYINPYINDKRDNLFMLQGSRTSHREYWLSRRFDMFDGEFLTGSFKNNTFTAKFLDKTQIGEFKIHIRAGKKGNYAIGDNSNIVYTKYLEVGEEWTVECWKEINVGDPIKIYNSHNIESLEIESDRLAQLDLGGGSHATLGNRLKEFYITGIKSENSECTLSTISGLELYDSLEIIRIDATKVGYIDFTLLKRAQEIYYYGTSSIVIENNPNLRRLSVTPNTDVTIRNCDGSNVAYIGGLDSSDATGFLTIYGSDSIIEQMHAASGIFRFRPNRFDITCSTKLTLTSNTSDGSILWDLIDAMVNPTDDRSFKGIIDMTGLSESAQIEYLQAAYQNGVGDIINASGDYQLITSVDTETTTARVSSNYLRTDTPVTFSSETIFGSAADIDVVLLDGNDYGTTSLVKNEHNIWVLTFTGITKEFLNRGTTMYPKVTYGINDKKGNRLLNAEIYLPYSKFYWSSGKKPLVCGMYIPSYYGAIVDICSNVSTAAAHSDSNVQMIGDSYTYDMGSYGTVSGSICTFERTEEFDASKIKCRITVDNVSVDIDCGLANGVATVIRNFWAIDFDNGIKSTMSGSISSRTYEGYIIHAKGLSTSSCTFIYNSKITGNIFGSNAIAFIEKSWAYLQNGTGKGSTFVQCNIYMSNLVRYLNNNSNISIPTPTRLNYCNVYTDNTSFTNRINDGWIFENCNIYLSDTYSGSSVEGCTIYNKYDYTDIVYESSVDSLPTLPEGTILGRDFASYISGKTDSFTVELASPVQDRTIIYGTDITGTATVNICRAANSQQIGAFGDLRNFNKLILNYKDELASTGTIMAWGNSSRIVINGNATYFYPCFTGTSYDGSMHGNTSCSTSSATSNSIMKLNGFTGTIPYYTCTINSKPATRGFASSSYGTIFTANSFTNNATNTATIKNTSITDSIFFRCGLDGSLPSDLIIDRYGGIHASKTTITSYSIDWKSYDTGDCDYIIIDNSTYVSRLNLTSANDVTILIKSTNTDVQINFVNKINSATIITETDDKYPLKGVSNCKTVKVICNVSGIVYLSKYNMSGYYQYFYDIDDLIFASDYALAVASMNSPCSKQPRFLGIIRSTNETSFMGASNDGCSYEKSYLTDAYVIQSTGGSVKMSYPDAYNSVYKVFTSSIDSNAYYINSNFDEIIKPYAFTQVQ